MAFREKSAWISVISALAVYGYYFWNVLLLRPNGGDFLGMLTGSIVLLVVIQIVLNIVAAAASPKDAQAPQDEREKLFALKGTRSAYYILVLGILSAITAALAGQDRYNIANGLFFALVVSELFKSATVIAHYRRGA